MNYNISSTTQCDQMDGINKPIVSQENLLQCTQCSQGRLFKGERGLKIHQSKCHKLINIPSPTTESISIISPSSSTSNIPFWKSLSCHKFTKPIIKRIPRGARISAATALSHAIKSVVTHNTKQSWEHLLSFPSAVLHVAPDPSNTKSLTTRIKENSVKYDTVEGSISISAKDSDKPVNSKFNSKPSPESALFRIVENKVGDGDIKGAARILFSRDTIAPLNPETLSILEGKHPSPAADQTLPQAPIEGDETIEVTPIEVSAAVRSFQCGSAGGIDALTPQHLKDLLFGASGEAGEALLRDLTDLINLMLSGQVNCDIISLLYGANLCALKKKDGGIRPIAVGMVYRRLAAKTCCKKIAPVLANYLQPLQLGFGSRGGCEAAVHSVRSFLAQNSENLLLKVDVKNAFNSLDRGALLTQVKDKIPNLYGFLWQCYGYPSKLTYFGNEISSAVGCQQGDPLGPALFAITIHPIVQRLKSKLNVWYLDDGTLGGNLKSLHTDLTFLTSEFQTIGLDLNFSKCELFIPDTYQSKDLVIQHFSTLAPNLQIVNNSSLRLLGSPILDESFPSFFDETIQNFLQISDRLTKINTHMAFTIIRFCLFVPKFTYLVRCCQLWRHPNLVHSLDNIIKNTLASILNVSLNHREWLQASLPVRLGGLGIRSISGVALPAFLSSVHSNQNLITKILTKDEGNFIISFMDEARNAWIAKCPNSDFPKPLSSQRLWDEPICEQVRNFLFNTCSSSADRARLLAVARWESGLWLQAHPSPNIGTVMDSSTFRIATALRLGASCCAPHRCRCGVVVDQLGHHGLSCARSAGRIPRHASLNDIIRRAFTTANCVAVLEPSGLVRGDGKRPDGMTLIPWKMGCPLVWDATCVDTLAPSHLPGTECRAGAAAESAEDLKRRKYSNLDSGYLFEPFGVETLGPWGSSAKKIYSGLSARLVEATRDQNAGLYFAQRVSIAIQRGNAASILGTIPIGTGLLD